MRENFFRKISKKKKKKIKKIKNLNTHARKKKSKIFKIKKFKNSKKFKNVLIKHFYIINECLRNDHHEKKIILKIYNKDENTNCKRNARLCSFSWY